MRRQKQTWRDYWNIPQQEDFPEWLVVSIVVSGSGKIVRHRGMDNIKGNKERLLLLWRPYVTILYGFDMNFSVSQDPEMT